MDWDDLRYLLAVHRKKSLASAARDLGVTKATASRRLAALETALGARLVERRPAGLVLTAAGQEALTAASAIDDAVVALEERIASASDTYPRGKVRLTAPQWMADRVFVAAMPQLRQRHPELEVELLGSNQMLNLAQREADVALRNVRPAQRSLTSRKVGLLGGCVYASKLYLERQGTPGSRREVAAHDVLVYETIGGMPGFEWIKESGGRIAFRANDPVTLVSAATAGLGLVAVPCLLGDREPTLVRVPALGLSRCDMFLVIPAHLRDVPRVRAVADFVVEVFRENRAIIEGCE
jgi:DNA-binding transcriptional LysR family regulator